jgi:hypothetical protein
VAERIVHLAAAQVDLLRGTSSDVLGRTRSGAWAAVDDRDVLEIGERGPSPALLYFRRADYESGIRGLSPAQIVEAVEWRLRRWAPVALERAASEIYRRERERLVLAAKARAEPADGAEILDAQFEHGLRLLASLVGERRYDSVAIADLVVFAIEADARILAEEARLAATVPEGRRGARAGHARALGAAVARMGRPEYDQSLPFVELQRVAFISPRDAELVQGLRVLKVPFALWREGVIARRPLQHLEELEAEGRTVRILYWNPGEWLQEVQDLTTAQLDREYEERRSRTDQRQPALEHVDSLRLEQALLRRNVLKAARVDAPEIVPLLETQVAEETRALREALQACPIAGAAASFARIAEASRAAMDDARLFAELAARAGNALLSASFASIAEAEREQLGRLAGAPPST